MSKVVWDIYQQDATNALSKRFPSLQSVFNYQSSIISRGPQSEVLSITLDGVTFYIKRYFNVTGLRSRLGLSRLRMEMRNQQRFLAWGLNAARVAAYGEESRLFSHTLRGVLITEGVQNSVNLEEIVDIYPNLVKDNKWLNSVISLVANTTKILHQHNFCHNDLFLRNLLIQHSDCGKPKLFLIDCPSGSFWFGRMLYNRKAKDIASLDKHAKQFLSKTQRLRFMHEYFDASVLSREHKQFINHVLGYHARRQRRKQRQKRL